MGRRTWDQSSSPDGRDEGSRPARPIGVPGGLGGRWWFLLVGTLLSGILAVPIISVLVNLFRPAGEVWSAYIDLTLREYIGTTIWLTVGVVIGATTVGVAIAWLTTTCDFPGRRWLSYVALLPMAMPAYLLAYTYADLLQYAGPVQTTLRDWFGWKKGDYWFPPIRSLGGAIIVMSAVLYPYVYLLARAAFLQQSNTALDAARMLGRGPWRAFAQIALPMARPAIVAGAAIAGMEALADYGTVKHFEVNTFSTAIYTSWFALGSPVGASKLAAGLLLFVFAVLGIERWARGRRRFTPAAGQYRPVARHSLRGPKAAGAFLACFIPPLIGFAIPAALLVHYALDRGDPRGWRSFETLARNSLTLALTAATFAVLAALALAYGVRMLPVPAMRMLARLSTMGYAVPGAVIAIGVMIPLGRADNAIDAWMEETFGISTGLLLSGTIFTLIFAYLIRFLAIAFNAVDSGLTRIPPHLDEAARTLGKSAIGSIWRVQFPLLSGSLLTALLLVFVDTLKELPATLVLRPFNFDTLAIRVYSLASDERLAEAASSALAIVAVGLIPVALLSAAIARSVPSRPRNRSSAPAGLAVGHVALAGDDLR